ncbi:hypothetical protein H0E87_014383 [Populus deltoides]|uniref:LysM domain-containing protein n=1 Tax=Populus deltoides TaxID=3696 RepID=A0A8T2YDC1_POPDE|nr:hypothetical protein H0E87_014383 [Populus deltoides]
MESNGSQHHHLNQDQNSKYSQFSNGGVYDYHDNHNDEIDQVLQFYSDYNKSEINGKGKGRITLPSPPSTTTATSSASTSSNGGSGFIEHPVSKLDTLAGVAIKYGVEVADIKKMNGLVTDLQMFALKSLQIPLPGRHPPSLFLSNGFDTPREENSGAAFSTITGKCLALRPKAGNRATKNVEAAGLISAQSDPRDVADGFPMVRKSSSTPSLNDQDSISSSIWPTSKWSLKPDLQALSASTITRPIFDGLPKPTGRKNKTALD